MKRSKKYWSEAVGLFRSLFVVVIIATTVIFAIFLWAVFQLITFEEASYSFPELEQDARAATVIATLIWFGSALCGCFLSDGIYFAANYGNLLRQRLKKIWRVKKPEISIMLCSACLRRRTLCVQSRLLVLGLGLFVCKGCSRG